VRVKDTGNKKKRVHIAIHNYWDTECEWNEIKLNNNNISSGIINNSEIKLEKNNILKINNKKVIFWQVENLKKAKLWTGVKEDNGIKIFDQKYVCIEPEMEYEGFVETDKSWLEPKKELVVEQRIRVER